MCDVDESEISRKKRDNGEFQLTIGQVEQLAGGTMHASLFVL